MADKYGFSDRVVVVTGGGAGLGGEYANFFAARGASVVVNDILNADEIVNTINRDGGKAVACDASVEDGHKVIDTAVKKFGRIDVLINNAGIICDRSFGKMTEKEWDAVYRVHLLGAYRVSRAAWSVMREQKFGRVIMTTSIAGLYGNFGQANYASVKAGLVGLARTLAIEGEKYGINVNSISPSAATNMGTTMLDPENVTAMSPRFVSPLVAFLCHEDTNVSGRLFEVGAGRVAELRYHATQGMDFGLEGFSPEDVENHWHEITDFSKFKAPSSIKEAFVSFEKNLPKKILQPYFG